MLEERPPSTVADYDDARRRARLAQTRLGHGWITLRRTRLMLLRAALVPIVLLALFAQYWAGDIAPERARLARTQPAVLPIAAPADARVRDTAVFDMTGLGTLDAGDTAHALPSLTGLGSVWAVRYDNTGIDTKVIGDLVLQVAQAAGVDKIVLVGHSMGGVIALEVAKQIHTASSKTLTAVILDCTPVDLDAVWPQTRDAGEQLLRWTGWMPGARESRTMRMIAEMYSRRDDFIDYFTIPPGIRTPQLIDVANGVLQSKIFNTDAASNGLIESQFKAIVGGGAIGDLRALSRPAGDKPRPAIVFIRPHDSYRDPVVDDAYSQKVLIGLVGGIDGTLFVVLTRHTGHADPIEEPREYNTVIAGQVAPFITELRSEELAAAYSTH